MYFIIAGNASFVKEISLLYPGADWGGESAAIRDILQKSFNQKAQYGLMAKSRVLLRFLFVESSDIIKPSNPKRKRENCMRTITAAAITDTVARLCVQANTRLPDDIVAALDRRRKEEPWPLAKETLGLLWDNMELAEQKDLPICQDTGMACVFVELGQDVHIEGDFEQAVHEGVRRGYGEGYLRKSIVGDPLRRVNTGDNTPAAITLRLVPGEGCTITVAPKGFGSENMSRLGMLKPADGVEGVKKFVLDTVRQAGPNPCPPIVLGIGVGGSFDKVAYLAKHALLRPIDRPNADPYYAQLEGELLEEINAVGIGPQGFGGQTTCLGLSIEAAPTHVAGLPVAVNVSCHVTRRATAQL